MTIVGVIGLCFAMMVSLPQLHKIISTGRFDVSRLSYTFLVLSLLFYICHAVLIGDGISVVSRGMNLVTNSAILILIFRRKTDGV